MTQFKTPVSMQLTQGQFERDLKKGLQQLGYSAHPYYVPQPVDCSYLITEFGNKKSIYGWNQDDGNKFFIKDYNPELFLALAAMTEGDKPIAGEWVNVLDSGGCYSTHPEMKGNPKFNFNLSKTGLMKVVKYSEFTNCRCVIILTDGVNEIAYDYASSSSYIRKATLEELVAHLGKKKEEVFVVPERWYTECTREVFEYLKSKYNFTRDYSWWNGWKYIGYANVSSNNGVLGSNYEDSYEDNAAVYLSIEQFREYFLNKSKEKMIVNKLEDGFQIDFSVAQRIINAACPAWKRTLSKEWGVDLLMEGKVKIPTARYKELRAACTEDQHKLFDEIFGEEVELIDGAVYLCKDADGIVDVRVWNKKENKFQDGSLKDGSPFFTSKSYVSYTLYAKPIKE